MLLTRIVVTVLVLLAAGVAESAMPLALPVTVQLVNGDDAGCWESIFEAPGVLANDAARFRGRAS